MKPVLAMLVAVCALCLVWGGPASALDAKSLFQNSKDSVVVVFAVNSAGKPTKMGSGVLLRGGNLVATNYHVIAGEQDLRVKLSSEKIVQVIAVRSESPQHDLAILKIPLAGRGLPLATGDPAVGEDIMAIGHPKGLERTLSTGVVSGIRQVNNTTFYQITAPISPGSSGGPILNANGQVVGLATFYAQGGQNLNFAIPAAYIAQLMGMPAATRTLGKGGSSSAPAKPKKRLKIERDSSGITIMQGN